MARKPQRIGLPEEPVSEIITEKSQDAVVEHNSEEIVSEKVEQALYKVKANNPSIRYRSAPSLSADIIGLIADMGIYEIYEERNGWGRLKNGCWTMLRYYNKIEE